MIFKSNSKLRGYEKHKCCYYKKLKSYQLETNKPQSKNISKCLALKTCYLDLSETFRFKIKLLINKKEIFCNIYSKTSMKLGSAIEEGSFCLPVGKPL